VSVWVSMGLRAAQLAAFKTSSAAAFQHADSSCLRNFQHSPFHMFFTCRTRGMYCLPTVLVLHPTLGQLQGATNCA
jgi:hypothetical protein